MKEMVDQKIDPWGNELVTDYQKLFAGFGLKHIDERILSRIKNKNRLFRRGIIFAHRDFDKFLDAYERGEEIAAMSGIKPTGDFHMGSKLTAEELIFLQKEFGAKVFYCVANLEAYADNGLSLEESRRNAILNIADLLALGLDPDKAYIYEQSEEKDVMNLAYLFAKRMTLSTLRALYGEKSMGLYFSVLTQAGDILLPQLKKHGGPKHVVVPVGIDQDPHIRLTRDLAHKFRSDYGFVLPSSTYHKFFRSLDGNFKMSKRDPMSMLSLGDDPEEAKRKIMAAFTGGRATAEEQRRLGAEVEKCVVCELRAFHFEEDDAELKRWLNSEAMGRTLCGESKLDLAEKVARYLKRHQEKRKRYIDKAREILESQGKR